MYLLQIMLQRLIPREVLRVRVLLIVATDLHGGGPSASDNPDVRWATRDDLTALAASTKWSAETLRARFESGARAVIAERDGRVIGAIWYRPDYCEMDDWLRFTGPAEVVWGIGAWIAPDCRGQRLFRQLKGLALAHYAQAGYSSTLGWIETLNRNSRSASQATGSRPIGRLVAVRCFRFTVVSFNGALLFGRWNAQRPLELPVDWAAPSASAVAPA